MDLKKMLELHKLWLIQDPLGARANLSKANLSQANLYEADLSKANLSKANLSGADLSQANLYEADLSQANLYEANLSQANLYEANLSGADLSKANLSRADLSRADLYGAKGIISFCAGQHRAVYSLVLGILHIGCEYHPLDHWLEHFTTIGEKHEYTQDQIHNYGVFIRSLKEMKLNS